MLRGAGHSLNSAYMLQALGGLRESQFLGLWGGRSRAAISSLHCVCCASLRSSQPPTECLLQFLNCFLNFVTPLLLAVP